MLPAVLLAAVYLIWAPPSADLAAQTFRADLFDVHHLEVWTNAWYAGVHIPGYSLLFPPLASVFGIRVVGAVAAVAATWLFAALVRPHYGDRARVAIWLFGLGSATNLFTGRLTFALGVAFGMGALLAIDRRHPWWGAVLAALAACASPVAGLFAAFAGGVLCLTGRPRDGLILGVSSLTVTLAMAMAFPTFGVEPFLANTFTLISLATLILIVLLPADEHRLRVGAACYLVMCAALFAIDTAVGGNVTRLGALMAAPLFALGAWGRRPAWVVGLALLPLLYWQWIAPVRDLADAVGEPSVEAAYYDPLLDEIERRAPDEPFRVQVPPTRNRWESVYVGERFPIARGWLRQTEANDFDLFQDDNLAAASYREWLDHRGVAFVAVATGAEPDYLSEDEIDLIHDGLPYLDEVWSNDDWELYEVADPVPIGPAPFEMTDDGFTLRADRPGDVLVAVRFTPYYSVLAGDACVSERQDFTMVEAHAAGTIEVDAEFTLGGLFDALSGEERICSG
jgi:hypothetical protein